MTLYRKSAGGHFATTAVPCPEGFSYLHCSWAPGGRWLAVTCADTRAGQAAFKLGIYDISTNKYVGTNTVIKPGRPVWRDDSTFYVVSGRSNLTPDGGIIEMRITPRVPVPAIRRILPLEEEVSRFYGMVDGQLLTRKGKEICLGDKSLVELDATSDDRIVVTETTIFVSASPSSLVAFDRRGHQVGKVNPGRIIQLGSIGKDPGTVYGLTRSTLQYILRRNMSLDVGIICDLGEFRPIDMRSATRL